MDIDEYETEQEVEILKDTETETKGLENMTVKDDDYSQTNESAKSDANTDLQLQCLRIKADVDAELLKAQRLERSLFKGFKNNMSKVEEEAMNFVTDSIHHPVFLSFRDITKSDFNVLFTNVSCLVIFLLCSKFLLPVASVLGTTEIKKCKHFIL